jgi:hypothetical protein
VLENRLLKTLTVSGSSMKEVRATADVRAPGHRRSNSRTPDRAPLAARRARRRRAAANRRRPARRDRRCAGSRAGEP